MLVKNNRKNNKVGFWFMWSEMKRDILFHALTSFLRSTFYTFVAWIINALGNLREIPHEYGPLLLSKNIRENFFEIKVKNKWVFFILASLIMLSYAGIFYLDDLLEEKILVKSRQKITRDILIKFRRLSFEDKMSMKSKMHSLLEEDAKIYVRAWEWPNEILIYYVYGIFALLFSNWADLTELNFKQIIICFSTVLFIFVLIFWIQKKLFYGEKKILKCIDEERKTIDIEREKAELIEASGLDDYFVSKQDFLSQQSVEASLELRHQKVIGGNFPSYLLGRLATVSLLPLASKKFNGVIVGFFGNIIGKLAEMTDVFRKRFKGYWSACSRIDDFFSLPEKNDNLEGLAISNNIPLKKVIFRDLSFHYKNKTKWIVKKLNQTFEVGQCNYLSGRNGIGKSTMIYLILGLIKPQSGQIIIELVNGMQYSLAEINLAYWRKNNVAYMSHDTLIEEGSTGQKQLANINSILIKKQDALVWIFDEADNALDKDNQNHVADQIKELVQKDKLVIYISHHKYLLDN